MKRYILRIKYGEKPLTDRIYTFHSFRVAWATFRAIAPFADHITLEVM